MRILAAIAAVCASVLVASEATASSERFLTAKRTLMNDQQRALDTALRHYGWSIPICLWPRDKKEQPVCYSTSQLIAKFPFEAVYISNAVRQAIIKRGGEKNYGEYAPEKLLDLVLRDVIPLDCARYGTRKGAVTLGDGAGKGSAKDAESARATFLKECEESSGSSLLGTLVSTASNTESVTSLGELPTYQQHLTDCQQAETQRGAANNRGPQASDAASNETEEQKEQRLEEESEKAEEERLQRSAEEKKLEAEQKKKQAEVAQEAADDAKKAATEAEAKAKAMQEAGIGGVAYDAAVDESVAAWKAYRDAQYAADAAAAAAAQAEMAYDVAMNDLKDFYVFDVIEEVFAEEAEEVKDDALSEAFVGLALGASDPRAWVVLGLIHVVRVAAGYAGAVSGGYFTCADESCAATCEQKAKAAAIRDVLLSHKKKKEGCNPAVRTDPEENDPCFDAAGGIFSPSQASLARAFATTCEKYVQDSPCASLSVLRPFIKGPLGPCGDPRAMCSPEQLTTLRSPDVTSKVNELSKRSLALPAAFSSDSGIWRPQQSSSAPPP